MTGVTRCANAQLIRFERNRTRYLLRLALLAVVASILLFERTFWTPDTLFILTLFVAVAFGQTRPFLVRFLPFVGLLAVYASLSSVADDLNSHVHVFEMIRADRVMFNGAIPTHLLQSWWWDGTPGFHDYYFGLLYTLHFFTPMGLALLIWRTRDELYWEYVTCFLTLSFAGFATYLMFPAAPPWMADNMGYIDIQHLSPQVWGSMGMHNTYSALYARLSPNPVAAVPSLHAAYPSIFVCFMWRLFPRRITWAVVAYPVSVWLGVIYLGEHYAIDVILGAAYAMASYASIGWVFRVLRRRQVLKQSTFAEDMPVLAPKVASEVKVAAHIGN